MTGKDGPANWTGQYFVRFNSSISVFFISGWWLSIYSLYYQSVGKERLSPAKVLLAFLPQ